jgi:PPM family protein phosphatase
MGDGGTVVEEAGGITDPDAPREFGGALMSWGSATDVGHKRQLNEDSLVAQAPVFVVADGMGGYEAGELASALTVELLRQVAKGPVTFAKVSRALSELNNTIHEHGDEEQHRGMGTTAVGLVLVKDGIGPAWLIFNVGDSRAYCYARGELVQLSVDHSYVQELVEMGELTPSAARNHPDRNVITRAIGAGPDIEVDYWLRPLRSGERYLLCSDGLHSEVEDGLIREVLALDHPAGRTAQLLVNTALQSGGRDNVSVVVVDIVDVIDDALDEPTGDTHQRRTLGATAGPPTIDASGPTIVSVPGVHLQETTTERPLPLITLVPSMPAAADVPTGASPDVIESVPLDPAQRPTEEA